MPLAAKVIQKSLFGARALRAFAASLLVVWGVAAHAQDIGAPQSGKAFSLLDAVRLALGSNPAVQLQRSQIAANEGALKQASASFDTQLQTSITRSRDVLLLTPSEAARAVSQDPIVTDTSSASLGLNTMLRNGVTLTPSLTLEQSSDSSTRALFGDPPADRGALNFTVGIPLMKNTGRDVLGLAEKLAQVELEASRADMGYAVSQSALDVAQAYWNYLAAVRGAEIAVQAEQSSQLLQTEITKLIAAGEVAAAEMEVVMASHAERRVARITAEQAVQDARNALARVAGLGPKEAVDLPTPTDEFPQPDGATAIEAQRWIDQALHARADLVAVQLRNEGARQRLDAARLGLKPQLDLTVGARILGVGEGANPVQGLPGLTSSSHGTALNATLTYIVPVKNSAAAGLLMQQSALLDQGLIRERDLGYAISTTIDGLAGALQRRGVQLKAAAEAVARYRKTLANEETKRRLGIATLIDVINLGDRLLSARLNENAQRLAYATDLARLRHEMGHLILSPVAGTNDFEVTQSSLSTLPP